MDDVRSMRGQWRLLLLSRSVDDKAKNSFLIEQRNPKERSEGHFDSQVGKSCRSFSAGKARVL